MNNLRECIQLLAGPAFLPKGCSKICSCKSCLLSVANGRQWNTFDSIFSTAGLWGLTYKTLMWNKAVKLVKRDQRESGINP